MRESSAERRAKIEQWNRDRETADNGSGHQDVKDDGGSNGLVQNEDEFDPSKQY